MQLVIKHDRVVRIFLQFAIGFNPIWHIRVTQRWSIQLKSQFPGMKTVAGFHQFQQIDDLMIAPVADIRPGIALFRNFPINPCATDAVRIVAIRRGGTQESIHGGFCKLREGVNQSFPILEDVAPVTSVIQTQRAVLIF